MILKLQGTRENETVHLVSTRKPIGDLRPGEYKYQKDSNSPVTAYRKKMSSEISDFQLNKVTVRKGEYEGKATRTYSLSITYHDHSHLIDLGGGMVAKTVINSLIAIKDLSEESRNANDVSISFYMNKKGYATATVRKHGEELSWVLDYETQKSYIDTVAHPFEAGKTMSNYSRLDAKFEELIDELNKTLPAGKYGGTNALDSLDDFDEGADSSTTTDTSIPFADDNANVEVEV